MRTIGSLIQTGRSIHVKRSPPAALQPSGLSNRHCFGLFCEIGKRFQKAAIMFPAGIYYVQTRGLPCLYEQTCLSNSVCPLYVQTRGCASSVRAGFSLLTGSVYIYVLIQKNNLQPWRVLVFDTRAPALCAVATSTRHEKNQNGKPNRKARRRGAVPAKPLGIGCRFSAVRSFLFIGFAVMIIS